jgi:tRNA threonylcarbamoyl adenosine modification protein YeaZ
MAEKASAIMALECSAGHASASIGRNGRVLAEAEVAADHGHAAWIISLTKEALEKADLGFDNLALILAGRGPGSFTGIRVALASAKGLALSLGIEAKGLSSLSAMAATARKNPQAKNRRVITMIDSRRGSTFFQAFTPEGEPLDDIGNGDVKAIANMMVKEGGQWVIAGFGTDDLAIACPSLDLIILDHPMPKASDLICLYAEKDNFTADTELEPLYLSAPLLGPR